MHDVRLDAASDSTAKAELSAGWPVLLAATLGCGAGLSSLPFYSLGSFISPLQQEFGWARGEISAAFLYLTLTLALTAPALGWLIDRVGPRTISMVAIPCFATVLFAISRFEGPICGLLRPIRDRSTGRRRHQPHPVHTGGQCPVPQDAGLALGITLAGMGVVAILMPPALSVIIAEMCWRTGFLMLLLGLAWIFVMMGFRNKAVTARPKPAQRRAILSQALKSRVFWTIALGFSAIAIAVSALVVHMVPLLRDAGMAPLQAAAVASFTGFGVLLGRIVIGWLIDHFFAPFVAAAVFTLTALGCLLLAYGGPQTAPFAAFLIGFSLGAEVDLISYLTARYFGMAAYGVLYAMIYAFFVVGASVGPVLAGRTFDMTGNYSLAIWMVIGLLMTGASAILTLPRFDAVPAKPDTSPGLAPHRRHGRELKTRPHQARQDQIIELQAPRKSMRREMAQSHPHAAVAATHSNPIDGFTVDPSSISYTGEGLQRPECILAARDGSLWAADARGGVVQSSPTAASSLSPSGPERPLQAPPTTIPALLPELSRTVSPLPATATS